MRLGLQKIGNGKLGCRSRGFSTMRASFLLLVCIFSVSPAQCLSVPLAYRQTTGDSWDVGGGRPSAPCENIREQLAFNVPPATREQAIRLLKSASVRELGDRQAADLLQHTSADHLLAGLLLLLVSKLQEQRTAALTRMKGSWSVEDEVTESDLIEVWQPHYPPYRPYLVRTLSGDQPKP
jgi:hypothetical protein